MSHSLTKEHCLIRGTGARRGRTRWVAPGTTAARFLHYGRVILGGGEAPLRFGTAVHEAALVTLADFFIPAFHAGAVDHGAHQRLRPGQALGHALRGDAAVAQPVAHHVFDQAQAKEHYLPKHRKILA